MLDTTHILYMLISGGIGAAIVVALRLLNRETYYRIAITACAAVTIALHYSPLWVEYLTEGTATLSAEMLFLVFPCHICMWLLVLSTVFIKKEGVLVRLLRDFTFLGGTICGAIGTILNENYDRTPDLTEYSVLKGLLSHSTMVLGCILLFVAGYAKIRMDRTIPSTLAGLALFSANGLFVNWLFARCGLPSENAMFLEGSPYPDVPWLNAYAIFGAALLTGFLIALLYEQFAFQKEERWYTRLGTRLRKK